MKKRILPLLVFFPILAFAQTYTFSTIVKFSKTSPSPANPNQLAIDSAGNLYGTSAYGGTYGGGSVYKVTPKGVLSVLYSFQNLADGGFPSGPVVRDSAGNLYGETYSGGTYNYGTIFKVSPAGRLVRPK